MKMNTYRPLEECITILKIHTVEDRLFSALFTNADKDTIICQVDETDFRMRVKRSYGNAFGPAFYGTMRRTPTGTEISGRFRMRFFTKVFITYWLVGTVIISIIFIGTATGAFNNYMGIIYAPLALLILGVPFFFIGKWLGKGEEEQIMVFLKESLSLERIYDDAVLTVKPQAKVLSLRLALEHAISAKPLPRDYSLPIAAFFLGIFSLLGFSFGIAALILPTLVLPYVAPCGIIQGIILLALAIGVFQRRKVVWYLGFFGIALSGLGSIFTVLTIWPTQSLITYLIIAILAFGGWYQLKDQFN